MQMRFLYTISGRFSLLDSKKSPGERAPHKDRPIYLTSHQKRKVKITGLVIRAILSVFLVYHQYSKNKIVRVKSITWDVKKKMLLSIISVVFKRKVKYLIVFVLSMRFGFRESNKKR